MSKKQHRRLGEILVEAKLITPQQLDAAIQEQKRSGQLLGATLLRMNLVSEEALLKQLQTQLELPLIDINETVADESALRLIKEDVAKKYGALPLEIEGRSTLVIAMGDPLNVAAIEDLRFHSGMFIRPVLASPTAIAQAIDRYYNIDTSMKEVLHTIIGDEDAVVVNRVADDEVEALTKDPVHDAEGRPIVRLTNWIMQRAVEERASDIHIEPQDKDLVVRLRIDGLLHEMQRLPKWTQSALVSRIKIMSRLDIAEKRLPQDGRIRLDILGRRVDMRVSTLPLTVGEKVVIRLADQSRSVASLSELGLQADDLTRVKRFLERPQGIILVTGPTGSGKSTLLYSSLRHIQHVTRNIVTVEDPVEVQIAGVNQVQVDEKAKKTFPAALRAILRQDPDVIMVGEIRDAETAQIAFRASVTGHMVLSTVHTNDTASAVTRLIDLGLEPFMVASSLISVMSIRLVRTLCPNCREKYEADASSLNRITGGTQGGKVTLWRGRGCLTCHDTGYHGRTGIFEMLEVNENLRQLIAQGVPDNQIRAAAVEAGMRSIGEDGLKKVLEGHTTLEEVTRVVYLAEQTAKFCPSCQKVLHSDFEYCPSCGEFVGDHCEKCRRRLQPDWTFCAHCGTDTARKRDRDMVVPLGAEDEFRQAS